MKVLWLAALTLVLLTPLTAAFTATTPDGKGIAWIDDLNYSCGGLTTCYVNGTLEALTDFCVDDEVKAEFTSEGSVDEILARQKLQYDTGAAEANSKLSKLVYIGDWLKVTQVVISKDNYEIKPEIAKNGSPTTTLTQVTTNATRTVNLPVDLSRECFKKGDVNNYLLPISKAYYDEVKVGGNFFGVVYDPVFLNESIYGDSGKQWSDRQNNSAGTWGWGANWTNGTFANLAWRAATTPGQDYWATSFASGVNNFANLTAVNASHPNYDLARVSSSALNLTTWWVSNFSGSIGLEGFLIKTTGINEVRVDFLKNGVQYASITLANNSNMTLNVSVGTVNVNDNLTTSFYSLSGTGNDVQYRIYYVIDNSQLEFEPPKYLNATLFYNTTTASDPINLSLRWTDNKSLSSYTYAIDHGNGTFVNQTTTSFAQTNNSNALLTTILNATPNSVTRWRVHATDTIGNGNTSEVYSLIALGRTYLTVQLYDELSLILINGTIKLQNSTGNQTTHNVANFTYPKSAVGNGNVTVQLNAPGYKERFAQIYINQSSTANETYAFYLLNNSNYSLAYYQVIDSLGSGIYYARVDVYKGALFLGTVFTDTSGSVSFPQADGTHTITATSPSGLSQTVTLATETCKNSANQCVIRIDTTANNTAGFYVPFAGVSWHLSPSKLFLSTNYSTPARQVVYFNLSFSSVVYPATSWGFNLTLSNGTQISTGANVTDWYGGSIRQPINTSLYVGLAYINATFWYVHSTLGNQTVVLQYRLTSQRLGESGIGPALSGLIDVNTDRFFWALLFILIALLLGTAIPGAAGGAAAAIAVLCAAVLFGVIPVEIILLGGAAAFGAYLLLRGQ